MAGESGGNSRWGAIRQSIVDACIVVATSQIDMAGGETGIEHLTG